MGLSILVLVKGIVLACEEVFFYQTTDWEGLEGIEDRDPIIPINLLLHCILIVIILACTKKFCCREKAYYAKLAAFLFFIDSFVIAYYGILDFFIAISLMLICIFLGKGLTSFEQICKMLVLLLSLSFVKYGYLILQFLQGGYESNKYLAVLTLMFLCASCISHICYKHIGNRKYPILALAFYLMAEGCFFLFIKEKAVISMYLYSFIVNPQLLLGSYLASRSLQRIKDL